jgi:hypothetical protein
VSPWVAVPVVWVGGSLALGAAWTFVCLAASRVNSRRVERMELRMARLAEVEDHEVGNLDALFGEPSAAARHYLRALANMENDRVTDDIAAELDQAFRDGWNDASR